MEGKRGAVAVLVVPTNEELEIGQFKAAVKAYQNFNVGVQASLSFDPSGAGKRRSLPLCWRPAACRRGVASSCGAGCCANTRLAVAGGVVALPTRKFTARVCSHHVAGATRHGHIHVAHANQAYSSLTHEFTR